MPIQQLIFYPGQGSGGASTFLELTDTPSSYTNQGSKVVKVKADETGLDFFSINWNEIQNKPETYPPESHTHTRSQITNFWNAPFWENIPDKPESYPPASHTHPRNDITNFWATPFWENIPDKPSTFPPSAHPHSRSEITDFWNAPFWNNIPDKPSTYPPSSHTHTESDLSLSDVTINNTTTSKHGFCPKLSGNSAQFLAGDGLWRTPSGGGSSAPAFWATSFKAKPPGITDYQVPYAAGSTAATTLALTASRTYWIPFTVNKQATITTIAINVTTASAGTHYVGIYASNDLLQPTGSPLVSCSFDTGSTGVKTASVNLVLSPGVYWACWAAGSAATVRAIALAASVSLGLASLGTANTTHFYTSGSTLPDPAPTSGYTAGSSALPAVGMAFSFS